MLDFQMTLGTLYLVFSDVFLMHKLGVVKLRQSIRLYMTPQTSFWGNSAIAFRDIKMAFLAFNAPFQFILVVKSNTSKLGSFHRSAMTGRATGYRLSGKSLK